MKNPNIYRRYRDFENLELPKLGVAIRAFKVISPQSHQIANQLFQEIDRHVELNRQDVFQQIVKTMKKLSDGLHETFATLEILSGYRHLLSGKLKQ